MNKKHDKFQGSGMRELGEGRSVITEERRSEQVLCTYPSELFSQCARSCPELGACVLVVLLFSGSGSC